jgi:hypothetical protein
MRTPSSGSGASSGFKVGDLVRLACFRDLVLGDHDARHAGDGREQVHLLLPAGLGALALLPVDRDALACGDVPGIAGDGGIEPGVAGVRPEPAVLAFLPEGRPDRAASASSSSAVLPARAAVPRGAAYAAGIAGSSASAATAPVRAASSSSASSSLASLSSIDADGATRSPVRGLTRQPCAASTSWP